MREPRASADIDAWLDALAGRRTRATGAVDAANTAEGLLLRDALRRWPVAEWAADDTADRARLAALLAAAHADPRLAARPGCMACQALARWLSWRRLAGATAIVAAAWTTVVIAPWSTSNSSPPGAGELLRGTGTEGVQRLRAADPRALRDRIAGELAQVGIAATPYERLGRYGLDAEVPAAPSGELIRLLGRYGISAPASGGLALEVEAGR